MFSKKIAFDHWRCVCAGQTPPGLAAFRTHPTRTAARATTATTRTATGRPATHTTSRVRMIAQHGIETRGTIYVSFEICRYAELGDI